MDQIFEFEELAKTEPSPTPRPKKKKVTAKDKRAESKRRANQATGQKRGVNLPPEVKAIIERQAVGVEIEENRQEFLGSVDDAEMGAKVAQMIIQGNSISHICRTLDISKNDIRRLVDRAAQTIQEEAGHVLLNYVFLSLSRYEQMIEVNMRHIASSVESGAMPNLEVQSTLMDLIAAEGEVIKMTLPKDNTTINITSTINTHGTLAREARERMFTRRPEPDDFNDLIAGEDIIIFPED